MRGDVVVVACVPQLGGCLDNSQLDGQTDRQTHMQTDRQGNGKLECALVMIAFTVAASCRTTALGDGRTDRQANRHAFQAGTSTRQAIEQNMVLSSSEVCASPLARSMATSKVKKNVL